MKYLITLMAAAMLSVSAFAQPLELTVESYIEDHINSGHSYSEGVDLFWFEDTFENKITYFGLINGVIDTDFGQWTASINNRGNYILVFTPESWVGDWEIRYRPLHDNFKFVSPEAGPRWLENLDDPSMALSNPDIYNVLINLDHPADALNEALGL